MPPEADRPSWRRPLVTGACLSLTAALLVSALALWSARGGALTLDLTAAGFGCF